MTGRAYGKHTQRKAVTTPGEENEIGYSKLTAGDVSPIPGGEKHVINAPVMHQEPAVPDSKEEYGGLEAHGVLPSQATYHERAESKQGVNNHAPIRVAKPEPKPETPPAVPVYMVEPEGPARPLRSASPLNLTLNASTGDAQRLCGKDKSRVEVMLLNESSSSNIRIAVRPSDLLSGGGALLPWPSNSYVTIKTQDELYAVSADSGTPTISVIQVFEGTGVS